jgi:hypothetical protein
MNRNTLTLLGCSGSLALILATGSAAQADTIAPLAGDAIRTAVPTIVQPAATPTRPTSSSHTTPDADSDTVGDLAIAKFHCDCPPCRTAVVQMLQTGQLSL